MTTILIRTVFIYIILIVIMRVLGKRQIGELEATELVTTLIISEIATMPITNSEMPVLFALIPMITIMTVEILMSFILIKIPGLRWLVSSHPSIVIKNGEILQKRIKKATHFDRRADQRDPQRGIQQSFRDKLCHS